ncbi:hypothetical protein EI71_00281 [Anaeroplasma bactoclasticum]|jgi:hypothetical protein|uniref:Sensory transduction regulator n=1 Tax=Anaeroplasma bactoclasticum TaxID=2088 RepID=A0A397RVG1_9MOLU|nr:hypothetical protein [Anaeroplasma bactoclasticum]RIA78330.1 hypothetical protein EI71_00281 [Anaeroplasma bactoclasticum]
MGLFDRFKKTDEDNSKNKKNTKLQDGVKKQLEAKNITVTLDDNGKGSFELIMPKEGYSLYPYYVTNSDKKELSIIINLRKIDNDLMISDYERINAFNLKSKYFQAKIKDRILYLEYNTKVDSSKSEIIHEVIESVFILSKEIDEL